jgi:hypothetical protein
MFHGSHGRCTLSSHAVLYSTSTIRNSRVSRSGRSYVEAKPRSPRILPGLEIASRDRIREIAAEAREAPLRRHDAGGRGLQGLTAGAPFDIRSVFSRCAEIIGETGADIGYEEFVNAHPALRELLLIKVGQESIQRRKAAFD